VGLCAGSSTPKARSPFTQLLPTQSRTSLHNIGQRVVLLFLFKYKPSTNSPTRWVAREWKAFVFECNN
jgi:hypothetical protein